MYASQGTLEALERANRLDNRFETEVIENEVAVGDMLIKESIRRTMPLKAVATVLRLQTERLPQ